MKDNGIKTVFFVLLAVLIGVIIYAACCRHSCDGLDDAKLTPNDNETISGEGMPDHTTEAEKTAFFEVVAKVVYFRDGVLTIRRAYEQEAKKEEADTCDGDRDTAGNLEHEERAEVAAVFESTEESKASGIGGIYEQKASEEVVEDEVLCAERGSQLLETDAPSEVETVASLGEEEPTKETETNLTDLYPECPQEYLYEMAARLHAYGVDEFLPFAVATMKQESHFNCLAENPNGLDKGLLQYRITYWPSVCREHGFDPNTSIYDWRVQIAIYAADAARRLHSGLSVEETVSRHNTSDYGAYNQIYVNQVMQWVR